MKTNSITDFAKFELGKTQLDKIAGGKNVEEKFNSGTGIGMAGKTVTEYVICYEDGSFSHTYEYTN